MIIDVINLLYLQMYSFGGNKSIAITDITTVHRIKEIRQFFHRNDYHKGVTYGLERLNKFLKLRSILESTFEELTMYHWKRSKL